MLLGAVGISADRDGRRVLDDRAHRLARAAARDQLRDRRSRPRRLRRRRDQAGAGLSGARRVHPRQRDEGRRSTAAPRPARARWASSTIAAGKTGTTNDKRDAWFIGFTPQTLTLTWIGFDDNTPTGLSGGDGRRADLDALHAGGDGGPAERRFRAARRRRHGADRRDERRACRSPNCPPRAVVTEAFKAGTQPSDPVSDCTVRRRLPPPRARPVRQSDRARYGRHADRAGNDDDHPSRCRRSRRSRATRR